MSDAISSILSQIRAHQMHSGGAMAESPASTAIDPRNLGGPGKVEGVKGPGFSETLNNAIDNVSRAQNNAGQLQQAFEMGDPRADLARVMVAMQQSSVAFRATVEVRNRMVQAYQDVMNMPV